MDQQNNPTTQNAQPVPSQQIPPEIHTFLNNILIDAQMSDLDEGTREEMINEMYVRLDQFIATTIVSKLTGEDVETFIKMNDEKKSQAEIQQFLQEKIPNAQEVMTQAFMDFRDLYLENTTVAQNAPPPENAQGGGDTNSSTPK